MSSFRVESPISASTPVPITPAIDQQSKVVQIATLVARVAISTIAAVAAFVFLPLPFAIITGAAIVLANVATCFCKCTSESQRAERSGSFDAVRIDTPPQSPSADPALLAAPLSTPVRPEPRRPVDGQEQMRVRFAVPPTASEEAQASSTIVGERLDSSMPSIRTSFGSDLDLTTTAGTPLPASATPQLSPLPPSLLQGGDLPDPQTRLSASPAAAPQSPQRIVDGGHDSEMPRLSFPNGFSSATTPPARRSPAIAITPALDVPFPDTGSAETLALRSLSAAAAPAVPDSKQKAALLLRLNPELLTSEFPPSPGASVITRQSSAQGFTPIAEHSARQGFPTMAEHSARQGFPAMAGRPASAGYRTLIAGNPRSGDLTGPMRRHAVSLSAAKAAAAAAAASSPEEETSESLLPGTMPETSLQSDVTL